MINQTITDICFDGLVQIIVQGNATTCYREYYQVLKKKLDLTNIFDVLQTWVQYSVSIQT